MKKLSIFLVICLLVLVGCAKEPLLGSDCATVSPDYRDECCARQNVDTIHIMCVGEWKFNVNSQECEFVCEESPEYQ